MFSWIQTQVGLRPGMIHTADQQLSEEHSAAVRAADDVQACKYAIWVHNHDVCNAYTLIQGHGDGQLMHTAAAD